MNPLADLRAAVEAAAARVRGEERPAGAAPTLERPPKVEFGDYSTNAAMLLAPVLGEPPRDIAQRLGDELRTDLDGGLERVEVAGPGFLNLFLSDDWFRSALTGLLAAGDAYGSSTAAAPERVLVEFVSANPTGPTTAASGRNAAYGDALARLLELAGHAVEREYYVNDYGTQVRRLGESIRARARGEPVPEDGYEGDYVTDLARRIPDAATGDVDAIARAGVALLLQEIRATLHRFRVDFDVWFSEASLHEGSPSPLEQSFAELEERGMTYRHDGALWLRSTDFGDEKDRVLERGTGEHTYLASDVAYHQDKRARGFDRMIDVWGADHHGYVQRTQAHFQALGGAPEALELVIMQFVHVVERGERASMSKRRGEFVTLDDLMDEIGVDATRFFLLQRSHDTTVDLDLDLAREQSAENPVYYVQYAHARIASMLRKAGAERVERALSSPLEAPLEAAERSLIKRLIAFPAEAAEAAERRAPHRMASYALELAQDFTIFYRDCQVVGVEPEALESQRIALSVAAQRVIARSLGLLGVDAPDAM
ncbi:MAG TPA: arginine--tRNA ligase [Solirubrobacteraceae bacterium]|jgi:arginyl-tRNA synthetase|nr:arginine--tRNA ligase [Solirubrobacteraceae bacterium]